jgi:hypothetical protein
LALKWLEPRFRRGYSRSPSTKFFGSRDDVDDIFLSLYYELKDALSFDDIDGFFEAAYNVAEIFEALSKLLRGGLHPQMYADILDIALHFTPILSVYVPDYMFLLIQCMHRMTGDDTATVKRMLDAITPPNREPLAQLALERYFTTQDHVGEKILRLLEDNPINPLGVSFW